MWLLPVLSGVSDLLVRIYYRLHVVGREVPRTGPVLLVANHPNSLIDPAVLSAVAGRPVRFLAKAPLFSDPLVGWLVRAAGAVPVHRRSEAEGPPERNEEAFRAAHAALAGGSVVGIFPEGISHSEPELAPLKTGAARIALGAAELCGGPFPIVPVGLLFRDKPRFRSEAAVVIGDPLEWTDLAAAGAADPEAVRALTRRLEEGLRGVTLNLERWEDAPLVEYVEEIYATEHALDRDPARRLARMREVGELLRRLRAEARDDWRPLAREVAAHVRVLRILGLRPSQLKENPSPRAAATWTLRHLAFFGLGAPLALLGSVVFWAPYRLTAVVERLMNPSHDARATHKLLVGAALHALWMVGLCVALGLGAGAGAGVAGVFLLPPLGLITLYVRERWGAAVAEARRYLVRERRGGEIRALRARQRELAAALEELRARTHA